MKKFACKDSAFFPKLFIFAPTFRLFYRFRKFPLARFPHKKVEKGTFAAIQRPFLAYNLNKMKELTEQQKQQFAALPALYAEWNARINVVSRKDIDQLELHHVQHSLAIAHFVDDVLGGWPMGTRVVDVGCGGGFPGVPLAIMYPEVQFLLVDRIGKKVKVAQAVADAIGLKNVTTRHAGIEEVKERFDYAVSRAVMNLPDLLKLVKRCTERGLICLKGGDLADELKPAICRGTKLEPVTRWLNDPYFEEKYVVYTPFK